MNARRATLALVLVAGIAPAGLRAQQGDIATTYRAAADSSSAAPPRTARPTAGWA